MSQMYRARVRTGSTRTTVSLSKSTVEGIQEIQRLFQSKYPKDAFPTLSYVLDSLLAERLKEFEADPEALAVEVTDFRVRYYHKDRKVKS